jgi:hypothetical protein
MKYNNASISKYLNTYAEPDIRALDFSLNSSFDSVLVIPVYDEPVEQLHSIINHFQEQSALLIFVFNSPNVDGLDRSLFRENKAAQQRTVDVFDELIAHYSTKSHEGYFQADINQQLTVFFLDYCREDKRLPAKQGVGLARKLGMDLGLRAIHQQYLENGNVVAWLHSSDADVCFPEGYFDISVSDSSVSALVYPFKHEAESGFEKAMALYDYSLRYYVEQLKQAGSPYAFHTIGSLIAVRPDAYALVRGFPKRSAGEDFYLLNKLAKVGSVHSIEMPIVHLAGRPSHRVPFGTGPALVKIAHLNEPEKDYTFYHPRCFKLLGILLEIISRSEKSFSSAELLFKEIKDRMSEEEGTVVIDVLRRLNIERQFKHFSQLRDKERFKKAFHIWFDAFVTLRFIHELRDCRYPNVAMNELP